MTPWFRRTAAVVGLMIAMGCLGSPAMAAGPAWTTYRHDAARSGIDPDSSSPLPPAPAWQTPALDGQVYGQPLVYGSRVYVATENDSVYALDAATGAVAWHTSAGTPVPAGKLPCGNITPTVGITSTPVIDPAANAIYAVATTLAADGVHDQHVLVGYDLTSGAARLSRPVDPPGSDPLALLQRAALALDGNAIVVGYGGNAGDCGAYSGWLVSAREDGGGTPASFQVDSGAGQHGGAIWGAGNGPAVDSAGNVFAATGNGFGSGFGYQESVLKLGPVLNLLDHWTPNDWPALDAGDTDIGSGQPLPLPGGPSFPGGLLFQSGKDANGYLLSPAALGGTGAGPRAKLQVCVNGSDHESLGGAVYAAGIIYVACQGGLQAVTVNTAGPAPTLALVAGWSVTPGAIGPPIIAGGLVWVAGWGNGQLYGLHPQTGAIAYQQSLGTFEHFATPSAGGGRLFVAHGTQVSAFTIARAPPVAPSSTSAPVISGAARRGQRLTSTHGTWTGEPTAFAYRWQDCDKAGQRCTLLANATASTYRLGGRDVGHTLRVVVTATNAAGAASATSTRTAVVRDFPPPALSRVRLRPSAFTAGQRIALRLTLSERASVIVVIARRSRGREVKGHCRARARSGRSCPLDVPKAKLTLKGAQGADALRFRIRGVLPGRYTLTVTARAGGRTSRPFRFTIRILR